MAETSFPEGVRPGGLTTNKEIRILLCYLLDSVKGPVRREVLEEVLVGEELANYFVLAEGLSQLLEQKLVREEEGAYLLNGEGRTIARTLAEELPRTVREAAVRGVMRTQHYAAKKAAHACEVVDTGNGRSVRCMIGDETGQLFRLELYMPDKMSAGAVREKFIEHGDEVYALVLAALTGDRETAEKALNAFDK